MAGNPSSGQLNRVLQGMTGNRFSRGSRLPSLRSPRDLTLGANQTSKRFTAPIIPIKRERTVQDNTLQSNESPAKRIRGDGGRGRGGRGRGDRGRGRGRGRGGVIQLESVLFGDGVAQKAPGRGRGGGCSGESSYIQKPKVSFDFSVQEVDDEEAKREFQLSTRDDFIDNDDSNDYFSACELPVSLPMRLKQLFSVKEEVHDECETKVKDDDEKSEPEITVKSEPVDVSNNDELTNGNEIDLTKVKIKEEPTTTEFDMTDLKVKKEIKKEKKPIDLNVKTTPSVGEVFEKATKAGSEELFLVKLPKPLPGLQKMEMKPKIKQEPGTSNASVSQAGSSIASTGNSVMGASLADISEGYIGKIQILKSGKSRMILGDVCLDVSIGNELAFLQDLVSLRVPEQETTGHLCSLGHVQHTLVCVPNIIAMQRKK